MLSKNMNLISDAHNSKNDINLKDEIPPNYNHLHPLVNPINRNHMIPLRRDSCDAHIPALPGNIIQWAKKYLTKNKMPDHQLVQYLFAPSLYVVFYPESQVLVRAHWGYFMRKQMQYRNNHKNVTVGAYKVLICNRWQPQSLRGVFDAMMNGFGTVTNAITTVRNSAENINSQYFKLLIIDLLSLIISIKDGLLTPSKVISVLMNIYTIHKRYLALFEGEKIRVHDRIYMPQSTSITDLLAGFVMLGLPERLIQAIKNFTALTGKRIFDSEVAIETLASFFDGLIVIIEWISEPITGFVLLPVVLKDAFIGIFQWFGKSVFTHRRIKQVCNLYSQYCANPQIMFNPTYRETVMKEYKNSKSDPVFMDYVLNSNNKYFTTTWNLFESNVIKSVSAFEESRRDEPICIVFEGPAGSGKSAAMNQFVDLLRQKGYTTYCHTIPASEDGKDFYDDYENQDVFVMDDIGIQGKSQWRYIINFVSPVKYPLPCATATKKNTKFFNSKIILCTTNHFRDLSGFTSADCITEPSALFRRCHVISVEKDPTTVNFNQVLKYFKYTHLDPMPNWVNGFVYHNINPNIPVSLDTRDNQGMLTSSQEVQKFLYQILRNIEVTNEQDAKAMVLNTDHIKQVIDDVDAMFAPQSIFSFLMDSSTSMFVAGCEYTTIVADWMAFIFKPLLDMFQRGTKQILNSLTSLCSFSIESMSLPKMLATAIGFVRSAPTVIWNFTKDKYVEMISGLILVLISWGVWHIFDVQENKMMDISKCVNNGDVMSGIIGEKWVAQSDAPERVKNVKKFVKFCVIKKHVERRDLDEVTNCVVSGSHVLLPAHVDVNGALVDLYHSYEHYQNNHKELENEQLILVRKYIACDLAVYRFKRIIPLYKKCNNLFSYNVSAPCMNPLMYLVNSTGVAPVLYGSSVIRNNEEVRYSKFAATFTHPVDSGFITNFSQQGACGTVLVSAEDGIIGFHVAGGVKHGFCVQPSSSVKEEIRSIMFSGKEPSFEIDERIQPGISGVRVRYQDSLPYNHVMSSTQFIKTIFNRDNNDDIRDLERVVVDDHFGTSVDLDKVDHKAPPNFSDPGVPAKEKIKKIALKSFGHQGMITEPEMAYIKDCIRSMMIPFDDLSDYETAFGGEYVKPINKDSSNGFNCDKDKESYFDFKNKIITDKAYQLFAEIKEQAEKEEYDYKYFVSRETFKDELRKSNKVDVPRTFRVMPLGHIWWTKKIFGKLLKHFANNRHKTGVCVGFNPYKDMATLYRKLKICEKTGDADFGKWDGSVLAVLIDTVFDVFQEYYRGCNTKVIDWLCVTIMKSFVIVGDEMWATTHGIPSGTWLTLLINCLINKALTALTIFRNKRNATVDDFHNVVDYVMGDDKIIGSSGEMKNIFNLLTIKKVAESLGMDCTNGDKSPITTDSHPLSKLTFLKRHIRQHPVLQDYIGCLSMDTILNTIQWMDKTKEVEESLTGKCRAMQIEAYLHSPILFKELTNIFTRYMPFEVFFDENKVLDILKNDDAYMEVCRMSGKDISWM